MRTPRSSLILRWSAAVAGAAYVAYVVVRWHDLVTNNNWDTDAVAKMVVAERLRGNGPVSIPHYGEWATLLWLLATRWLPNHRDVWAASGYVWMLAGAAVLAWATSRVAGRWAGLTAAATMLVVGPFVLRSYISTTGAHTTTPVATVGLAAVLVMLVRRPRWVPALAGGLFVGLCTASDPLFWLGGIAPFAIVVLFLRRHREFAIRASALLGVSVVAALATNAIMHALDFHVEGLNTTLASLRDLPHNVVHLGRESALLGGANYALVGPYPREPVRTLIALLTFAAIAAPLVLAFRARGGTILTRAYSLYWAAATLLLALSFVATPNAAALGPKSVNYVLTFVPAAAVGITLLVRSAHAQAAVAACVALVAVVNIAYIHDGRAEVTGAVALPQHVDEVVRTLDRAGARRGYAGYWDAQNLSWQTDMHLLVAPVRNCGDTLCPNNFFTISSWYEPRGGPTFLLVDTTLPLIDAPGYAKSAAETHRFGPLTLYVFDDDVASRFRGLAASETSASLRRFLSLRGG